MKKRLRNTTVSFTDDPSISIHHMLYRMRQRATTQGDTVCLYSSRINDYRSFAKMYFSHVIKTNNTLSLRNPIFVSYAIDWGEHPDIYGPRDYFRNTIILKELKKYRGIRKILDYGCGIGNMFTYFVRNGYTATGMDISKTAIDYVKKKVATIPARSNVRVICGTFETVPVPSRTFDAIWCGEVLEHAPDDATVVKNFYRVLRAGGRCFISVPHSMQHWSDIDEYWGHYRRYSEDEIRSLFRRYGFIVERTIIWGFPLSRLWDNLVYNHLFRRKVTEKKLPEKTPSFLSKVLNNNILVRLGSLVFYFDQLWNWTKLGKGIILVARKPKKKL